MSKTINELLRQLSAENAVLDAMSPDELQAALRDYLTSAGPNASWEARDTAVAQRAALETKLAKLDAFESQKKKEE